MKKIIWLTIFLFPVILAFSQNRVDTTLYVEPISGGSPADQDFFAKNLKMEITAAGYTVIDDRSNAIYSLGGALSPENDGFTLNLTLSSVEDGRELIAQELFYVKAEDTYEYLPFVVWQMLATAPFRVVEIPPPDPAAPVNTDSFDSPSSVAPVVIFRSAVPDDSWKNKWLYVGARPLGISPRWYIGDKPETSLQFIFGVEVGVQVLDFLMIQLEANFGLDGATFRVAQDPEKYFDVLYFPLLVKWVFKPGSIFLVEPYGGIYYNLPLGGLKPDTIVPFLGASAGVEGGIKAGPGIIVLDLRFSMDIGKYQFNKKDTYTKVIVAVTAGYRMGFINR